VIKKERKIGRIKTESRSGKSQNENFTIASQCAVTAAEPMASQYICICNARKKIDEIPEIENRHNEVAMSCEEINLVSDPVGITIKETSGFMKGKFQIKT
jgi:hypothetical protein